MKPTPKQVIAWALDSGFERNTLGWSFTYGKLDYHLGLLAALAYEAGRADENEACARLCDSSIHDTYIEGYTGAKHSGRRECAAAIRARREQ